MQPRRILTTTLLPLSLVACTETEPDSATESEETLSAPPPIERDARIDDQGNILADTFDVVVEARGNRLTLALRTDLPDAARLMVGVGRRYHQEGDPEDYSITYFSESSTVGEWRRPHIVELAHDEWRTELEETRRIMASAGEPFSVASIDDEIRVAMTVPVNQEPPFEPQNANLRGSVVEEGSFGRTIRGEVSVELPLEGTVSDVTWADPLNLAAGRTYRLSRVTPLAPDPDPTDPMQAVAEITQLPASTEIRVVGRVEPDGHLWYEVEANGRRGWINSIALLGQEITEVE